MAAVRQSPAAIDLNGPCSTVRQWLVRLGHLSFDDFLLVPPETLDSGHWTSDLVADWATALNNAPNVGLHVRSIDYNLQPANCRLAPAPTLSEVQAAQQRLVTHYVYELLRAKAPPLYDALPWHDWDFSIVAKRFPLWKTRFLLAGDGTTVAMCRCRKSAGVYILEPDETIARYIERKAALEKVRRFRLVRIPASSPSPQSLAPIPLPDNSVDLAVIGFIPSLDAGHWKLVTHELCRISRNVLVVENNPLAPPLDERPLVDAGFLHDQVAVSGLGMRRCWWRTSGKRSPA
jgi:hypothetical protein